MQLQLQTLAHGGENKHIARFNTEAIVDFLTLSFFSIGTSLASQRSHSNDAFSYYLRESHFSFFLKILFEICGPFFCIYEHVVAEHLPQAQHSTANRNQPCTKQQTKNVPITARRRNQAARARMTSSTYAARCVFKTNEYVEICPAYKNNNHSRSSFCLSSCDAVMRGISLYFKSQEETTLLFHSVLSMYSRIFRTVEARGVRVVILENGALGICKASFCT